VIHAPSSPGGTVSAIAAAVLTYIKARFGLAAMVQTAGGIAMKRRVGHFRPLYETNQQLVWRLLARMVGPREADHLVQKVFGRVAAALPGFRPNANASVLLYRLTAEVVSDWLSSTAPGARAIRSSAGADAPPVDAAAEAGTPGPNCNDPITCMRDALGTLAETDRVALLLGEFSGLDAGDLSRTLGLCEDATQRKLHGARERFDAALARRCGEA